MKVLAAFSAAASRVGSTSLAIIEPEWSVTSTIEALSIGLVTLTLGLARATDSGTIAARASSAGRWRRQAGTTGTAASSEAAAGKRMANFFARPWRERYSSHIAGRTSSVSRKRGEAKLI